MDTQKQYRVIIVDDEPIAREIVEDHVGKVPELETVAVCANAHEAYEAIQRLKPDLVFLDIQMPGMTGLELMAQPFAHCPDYVLTTAYPDYAVQSYDFSVLHYLMKPITFERFMAAVIKFLNKHTPGGDPEPPGLVSSSPVDGSIWLRVEKSTQRIRDNNILYVKGETNYVMVYLENGKKVLTHMNMAKAEKVFMFPVFIRIHKSYIVRLSAIDKVEGNTVTLSDGTKVFIGPKFREKLKQVIPILP